jgi:hypothetical protein
MTPTWCHHGDMENIAARDQADAREREFERRARKAGIALWAFALVLGAYCTLAVLGVVPAAPWSPLGQ